MDLKQLINNITPEIYENLRRSVELGKWPDGRKLTQDQKALCMEAVIYYENTNNIDERSRVGFIDRKKVEETECNSASDKKSDVQPLNFK